MTVELDDVPFSVVRRGYDRDQVVESLTSLRAELNASATARDAAAENARTLSRQLDASRSETLSARAEATQALAEIDRLAAQVAELSTVPDSVDGMSERLQQMVRIAQDEVNDMRTRATASAAQIHELAQAEADELRERSNKERRQFETERKAAEEALRAQLEESQTRLDKLRNDSEGQRAGLAAELAERQQKAEAEFAGEFDKRRTAMLDDLSAQETRLREDAARILDAASQEARTRLAEATAEAQRVRGEARSSIDTAQRELDELRALQHQIAEQLTSLRALLDWTLPQINSVAPRSAGPDAIATGAAAEATSEVPSQRPELPAADVPASEAASAEVPQQAGRSRPPGAEESPAAPAGPPVPQKRGPHDRHALTSAPGGRDGIQH